MHAKHQHRTPPVLLTPHMAMDTQVLPSLRAELATLRTLRDLLQKRLDLEIGYSSSLSAWHTAARHTTASRTTPRSTPGLHDIFRLLVEGTDHAVQSCRSMEDAFGSQLEETSGKLEELQGFLRQTNDRLESLEQYDNHTAMALEERDVRYREWKAWRPQSISRTRGFRLGAKQKVAPIPSDSALVAAYDHTDLEVRRCISKAEVVRHSFKQKAIEDVESISRSHQLVIESIGKSLLVFADNQQEYARNVNLSAIKLVNAASGISASRIACILQETLTSESEEFSITSMQYVDPEAKGSTIRHPIIYGFSLPSPYLSRTPSTDIVVKVFRQMVSCVRDHQAWTEYINDPTLSNHCTQARRFRDLERSWTGNEIRDRELFTSLGPSTCANLIKALLVSLPEPLIEPRAIIPRRMNQHGDEVAALVPLLERIYQRPQGEMLHALCDSLVPFFATCPRSSQEKLSVIFSALLTRQGPCIAYRFPALVIKFRAIISIIESRNMPRPHRDTMSELLAETPIVNSSPGIPPSLTTRHLSADRNSGTFPPGNPRMPVKDPLPPIPRGSSSETSGYPTSTHWR